MDFLDAVDLASAACDGAEKADGQWLASPADSGRRSRRPSTGSSAFRYLVAFRFAKGRSFAEGKTTLRNRYFSSMLLVYGRAPMPARRKGAECQAPIEMSSFWDQ